LKRLLLHTCCANCLADVLDAAGRIAESVAVHFYNPNVQPLMEYRRRRKSFLLFARALSLEIVDEPAVNAHPGEFLLRCDWRLPRESRCTSCYRMRLERTAAAAALHGFDAFSSTLLSSPHQFIDKVLEAGREAARIHSVKFIETDWRGMHDTAGRTVKGFHPYRQQYCGCIMSEYERFEGSGTHLVACAKGHGEGAQP